ncbi:unnamed protein product [Amoebophrya sp. A25]|nr:unnamed protein product [Amoebophrya sp. A25]|eukprot:GSA25T00004450001.1
MEKDVGRLIRRVDSGGGPFAPPSGSTTTGPSSGGSSTGPVLCKWGCGHQVQPGLTRNLNAYDTCCKKCGITKGQGGHDPNCPGPPGSAVQSPARPPPSEPLRANEQAGGSSSSNVRGTSVPEIEKIASSTRDLQELVKGHLKAFGSGAGGHLPSRLMHNEFQSSYSQFCAQFLIDENFSTHLKKFLPGYINSGGGSADASDLLSFYREILRENLRSVLQPQKKLEIERKMLVRQNPGSLEDFYKVGRKLGEGSFGSVHLVETKSQDPHFSPEQRQDDSTRRI